jgi:putative two-component system response regulator
MVTGAGKRILVVEDSNAQAASLAEILTGEHYAVDLAPDGVEALRMLRKSAPHMVITDVWMPRMNGYELCTTLKQDRDLCVVPVILLTSMSSFADILKGLNSGADYYLTKPYSVDLLLSTVKLVLSPSGGYDGVDNKEVDQLLSNGSALSRRMLNFLYSAYGNLLHQNEDLTKARRQLGGLNKLLEKRVAEKTDSLQNALNGAVIALSRILEIRDPYTAGHQSSVARLAEAIGQAAGLAYDRIAGIKTMGLLHDIGKIVVPAEILCKPSKLTDYEFHFIRQHSQAGYDILKGIDFPWPVADAVIQHHERLDGSGYPAGLTEGEIILEAKILAIADVVESMASHRPYRPALGIDEALKEIQSRKGALYDERLVEVTIDLFQKGTFSFE